MSDRFTKKSIIEKIEEFMCRILGHDFISDPEVCERCGELRTQILLQKMAEKRVEEMNDARG